MQTIDINDIVVPEGRQRQKFNARAMEKLIQSISKPMGLLQPIVLRNDGKTLVAGERRLRAVTHLYEDNDLIRHNGEAVPDNHIAYVILDDLSPEEIHEAELEENVHREDLTWQEKARATKELHQFRVEKDPNYTITKVAEELNEGEAPNKAQINETAELIDLADMLDDPLVGNAGDLKAARKALKTERVRQKRQALAATFDPSATPHILHESSSYEHTPTEQFDVIITDPPYGIDAHLKDTFDADRHEYDDSDAAFRLVCEKLPGMSYAFAKPNAHAYIFCDIRRFNELFAAFELSGWTVWNRPIIWDKGNTGSYGNIEYGFRACYEAILFARKGDRKFAEGHRDIINISQKTTHSHPAGKPVELYTELLKRSAFPGDTVGDFYAGGGTIFSAASVFGCTAVGWEIHDKYIELCKERLLENKDDSKS